tara:strand:+ start:269 stop:478 length:210 start_codon:yes stop_codon:yes gene_type:complete
MAKIWENGVIREMTQEELSAFENEVVNINKKIEEEKTAEEVKENLKASAKAKLIAGEPLTEDEANTIVL